MKQAIEQTQQYFESATQQTPQYKAWHRQFKRALTAFLVSIGCTGVEVRKPNHFDMSGFFTDSNGQAWYFRISDVRWSKESMLIRTATNYADFSGAGGHNQYVNLKSSRKFEEEMKQLVGKKSMVLV